MSVCVRVNWIRGLKPSISAKSLEQERIGPKTRKPVKIDGRAFNTIAEAARHYEIDPKLVYDRLAKGKTLEQAMISNKFSEKTIS